MGADKINSCLQLNLSSLVKQESKYRNLKRASLINVISNSWRLIAEAFFFVLSAAGFQTEVLFLICW